MLHKKPGARTRHPRDSVLLFHSDFCARAHATWQKARSQPSGGLKIGIYETGALFRVKPSGQGPCLMPTIELVT